MNFLRWLTLVCFAFIVGCQPSLPITVLIVDGNLFRKLITNERIPSTLLDQAGIILGSDDRLMLNGIFIPIDQPLPSSKSYTFQILRAATLNINGKNIRTSALTVGEALLEADFNLYVKDMVDPTVDTPITGGMTIDFQPSQDLIVTVSGRQNSIRSATQTVGEALTEAGFPLLEFDTSQPNESETLPLDGKVQISRVSESVILSQKTIPFKSNFQLSTNVELDHQEVTEPGQLGLNVSRTRVRFENGAEVARQTESETVVRYPRDRVVGYGTKVVIHTAVVDGVQIKYWRAVQMFTTAYSPCNSGGDRCYPGTSSGKPVQKGVTAVKYSWYLNMQGQSIFIPGYGYATIEDVCGGCVGKPWIDLGYTDAQLQQEGGQWGKFVTIYFLAPAPANILYVLE